MSVENVEKFFGLVKSNENTAKELIKIKDKLQQKDKVFDEAQFVKDEIIPLAQKNGIDFTPEEFLNYVRAQISELSDEDLLNVSGGGSVQNFLLAGMLAFFSSLPLAIGVSNFKLVENVAQETTTQNSETSSQTSQGGSDGAAASAKAKTDRQKDKSSEKKADSRKKSSKKANKNMAATRSQRNSSSRPGLSSRRGSAQNGSVASAGLQSDAENLNQPQLSTPTDVSSGPSVPTGSEISQNNSVKSFTSEPKNEPAPNTKTNVVTPAPAPVPVVNTINKTEPEPTPPNVTPVNNKTNPEPAPAPRPVINPINNNKTTPEPAPAPVPAPQPNIKPEPTPQPKPEPAPQPVVVNPENDDVHRGWTAERARALANYLRNNFDLGSFSEAVLDSETENSLKDFLYNSEVTKKGTFIHGVHIDDEVAETLFDYAKQKYNYLFRFANENDKFNALAKTLLANKDPESLLDFADKMNYYSFDMLKNMVDTWQELIDRPDFTEYRKMMGAQFEPATKFIAKAKKLIKAKNSVNKGIKDVIHENETPTVTSSFNWQRTVYWASALIADAALAYLGYTYGNVIYSTVKAYVVSLFNNGVPLSEIFNKTVNYIRNLFSSNNVDAPKFSANITTNSISNWSGSGTGSGLVDPNNPPSDWVGNSVEKASSLVSQSIQKIDAPGVVQKFWDLVEYGKSAGNAVANYVANWGGPGASVANSVNKIATGNAVVDPSNPPSDWVGNAVEKASSLVSQSMQKVDAPGVAQKVGGLVEYVKSAGNAVANYVANWGGSGTGSAVVNPANPTSDWVGNSVEKASSLVSQSMQKVDVPDVAQNPGGLVEYVNSVKEVAEKFNYWKIVTPVLFGLAGIYSIAYLFDDETPVALAKRLYNNFKGAPAQVPTSAANPDDQPPAAGPAAQSKSANENSEGQPQNFDGGENSDGQPENNDNAEVNDENEKPAAPNLHDGTGSEEEDSKGSSGSDSDDDDGDDDDRKPKTKTDAKKVTIKNDDGDSAPEESDNKKISSKGANTKSAYTTEDPLTANIVAGGWTSDTVVNFVNRFNEEFEKSKEYDPSLTKDTMDLDNQIGENLRNIVSLIQIDLNGNATINNEDIPEESFIAVFDLAHDCRVEYVCQRVDSASELIKSAWINDDNNETVAKKLQKMERKGKFKKMPRFILKKINWGFVNADLEEEPAAPALLNADENKSEKNNDEEEVNVPLDATESSKSKLEDSSEEDQKKVEQTKKGNAESDDAEKSSGAKKRVSFSLAVNMNGSGKELNRNTNLVFINLAKYLQRKFPLENFSKESIAQMKENNIEKYDNFVYFTNDGIFTKAGIIYDGEVIDANAANILCQYISKIYASPFEVNIKPTENLFDENDSYNEELYGKPVENEVMRCFLHNKTPKTMFKALSKIDVLKNLKALLGTYQSMVDSGTAEQYPQFMQEKAVAFATELENFIKEKEQELINNNDDSEFINNDNDQSDKTKSKLSKNEGNNDLFAEEEEEEEEEGEEEGESSDNDYDLDKSNKKLQDDATKNQKAKSKGAEDSSKSQNENTEAQKGEKAQDAVEVPKQDILASGYCGSKGHEKDLQFTLYKDTGELVISVNESQASSDSFVGELSDSTPFDNMINENKVQIKKVTIKDGVKSIKGNKLNESCFSKLDNITEVVVEGETAIEAYAFKYCKNLSKIATPKITKIGEGAFFLCEKLSEITIPNTVTAIENSAFNLSGLQSIDIPNSVTAIGSSAFCFCQKLTEVTIPNSVKTIGMRAFKECSALQSISLPNSITKIEDFTFEHCTSLEAITIPSSVTYIGAKVFNKCTNLPVITIPGSVTTIKEDALSDCLNLKTVNYGGDHDPANGIKLFDLKENKTINVLATYESDYLGCAKVTKPTISVGSTNDNDSGPGPGGPDFGSDSGSDHGPSFKGVNNEEINKTDKDQPENNAKSESETADSNNNQNENTENYENSEKAQDAAENQENKETKDAAEDLSRKILESGTCGSIDHEQDLNFTLYADGELVISVNESAVNFVGELSDSTPFSKMEHKNDVKTVTIKEGVKSIKGCIQPAHNPVSAVSCFCDFKSLGEIKIESNTEIGASAFRECKSLTQIYIPNATSIGECAFHSCKKLAEIAIPSTVTQIEAHAFFSCYALKSINIPNTIKEIGSYAFDFCKGLESITILSSFTKIHLLAFNHCPKLKTITFGGDQNPATSGNLISADEFTNTPSTKIILPPTYKDNYFGNIRLSLDSDFCGDLSTNDGKDVKWTLYKDGELEIKGKGDMIAGYPETNDIPWYGYKNIIKSIKFVKGVTSIAGGAFVDCSDATSIDIPDGITKIGQHAFGRSGITEIKLPESVTSIESYAFSECKLLAKITLPDSLISLGEYAFNECSSLMQISIPSNVTNIMPYTFNNCINLVEVKLTEGLNSIEDSAFYNCISLKSIDIPKTVTSIGASAFFKCSKLGRIDIKEGLRSIGDSAFNSCTSLESLTIPGSVTSIGQWALVNCGSLKYIIYNGKNNPMAKNASSILSLSRGKESLPRPYVIDDYEGNFFCEINLGNDNDNHEHNYEYYYEFNSPPAEKSGYKTPQKTNTLVEQYKLERGIYTPKATKSSAVTPLLHGDSQLESSENTVESKKTQEPKNGTSLFDTPKKKKEAGGTFINSPSSSDSENKDTNSEENGSNENISNTDGIKSDSGTNSSDSENKDLAKNNIKADISDAEKENKSETNQKEEVKVDVETDILDLVSNSSDNNNEISEKNSDGSEVDITDLIFRPNEEEEKTEPPLQVDSTASSDSEKNKDDLVPQGSKEIDEDKVLSESKEKATAQISSYSNVENKETGSGITSSPDSENNKDIAKTNEDKEIHGESTLSSDPEKNENIEATNENKEINSGITSSQDSKNKEKKETPQNYDPITDENMLAFFKEVSDNEKETSTINSDSEINIEEDIKNLVDKTGEEENSEEFFQVNSTISSDSEKNKDDSVAKETKEGNNDNVLSGSEEKETDQVSSSSSALIDNTEETPELSDKEITNSYANVKSDNEISGFGSSESGHGDADQSDNETDEIKTANNKSPDLSNLNSDNGFSDSDIDFYSEHEDEPSNQNKLDNRKYDDDFFKDKTPKISQKLMSDNATDQSDNETDESTTLKKSDEQTDKKVNTKDNNSEHSSSEEDENVTSSTEEEIEKAKDEEESINKAADENNFEIGQKTVSESDDSGANKSKIGTASNDSDIEKSLQAKNISSDNEKTLNSSESSQPLAQTPAENEKQQSQKRVKSVNPNKKLVKKTLSDNEKTLDSAKSSQNPAQTPTGNKKQQQKSATSNKDGQTSLNSKSQKAKKDDFEDSNDEKKADDWDEERARAFLDNLIAKKLPSTPPSNPLDPKNPYGLDDQTKKDLEDFLDKLNPGYPKESSYKKIVFRMHGKNGTFSIKKDPDIEVIQKVIPRYSKVTFDAKAANPLKETIRCAKIGRGIPAMLESYVEKYKDGKTKDQLSKEMKKMIKSFLSNVDELVNGKSIKGKRLSDYPEHMQDAVKKVHQYSIDKLSYKKTVGVLSSDSRSKVNGLIEQALNTFEIQ